MNLQSRLRQLLETAFADEEDVAGVAGTDKAPAEPAWSAADHVAHYSYWRGMFVEHTKDVLAGRPSTAPPEDVDVENEAHLASDGRRSARALVERWRTSSHDLIEMLTRSSENDLERAPDWYAAPTLAAAIVRNSYTHPRGHLIDFHFERGRSERAAQLAIETADVVAELSELDFRFPAGTHAFRAIGLALGERPEAAVEALRKAVTLRPVLGPMMREERTLASLRGRPDFEEVVSVEPSPG